MKITKLERNPGVWRLRVETKDEFGRRKFFYYKAVGTAEDADAEIQKLLLERPYDKPKKQNVKEYFLQWVDYRIKDKQIRPQTGHTYVVNSQPIFKLIGHMDITQLNKEILNNLYKKLLSDYSPAYVKEMAMVFNRSIRDAVEDELIEADPTVGVKRPKAKRELKTTTFTTDQIRHLLDISKCAGYLGPVIRFSLATGLRRGEICALQKQDIDLDKGVVHVRKSFVFYNSAFHMGATKTKSSNRTVSLPEEICEELAFRLQNKNPTDWVFTSLNGEYLSPRNLTRAMTRFFRTQGFGDFSCHDLRHAHATYLLQHKMHPKAVSQRLGHSDIKTTLAIYSHVLPGDDEVLAKKIGNLF